MTDAPCHCYLYTYACPEEEEELCALERRALFGADACSGLGWVNSPLCAAPERSPFLRQRLSVRYEAPELESLVQQLQGRSAGDSTFAVRYVKLPDRCSYEEQRRIEAQVGAVILGKADVRSPGLELGIAYAGGRWLAGELVAGSAVWLKHQSKPRSYSTALSTRVARALVNIALPYPDAELGAKRLYDPCCGIGTVLVEACSMGVQASGSDVNPLAVIGARENLRHYGYSDAVTIHDISQARGSYDAVIVDLPYNLCSVSSPEERLSILRHARRLSSRVVVVSTEDIGEAMADAGLAITDQCSIPKGKLVRRVWLSIELPSGPGRKNS